MNTDNMCINNQNKSHYDPLYEEAYKKYHGKSYNEVFNLLISMYCALNRNKYELALARNAQFGAKSEQIQLPLFNDDGNPVADDEEAVSKFVEEKTAKKIEDLQFTKELCDKQIEEQTKRLESLSKKRVFTAVKKPKKTQKKLEPEETVEYHADPSETCPICGAPLVHTGVKTRKKYIYIPARIKVVEEQFETVSCPNKCSDENGKSIIKTVKPAEPDLIDKSPATSSLVAGLVYNKYLLDLPFYRIEKDFESSGIDYSRQTMSNVTQTCFEQCLKPVYNRILSDFKKLSIVHMDETTLQCLQVRNKNKKSMMVVGVSGTKEANQMTVYRFFEGKKQSFVTEMLGDGFSGAFMTDGLQAYANYPSGIHLLCMAHARRRFYEAMICRDDYHEFCKLKTPKEQIKYLESHPSLNILTSAVSCFTDLYSVESSLKDVPAEVLPEVRLETRRRRSREIFEKLKKVSKEIGEGFAYGTKAERAGRYFNERSEVLRRYLEDGNYPIDNNLAERKIKVFVMARKNFLFSNSAAGAEAAAGYMTLMESAKDNNLNPLKYLEFVLETTKKYKKQEIPEEVMNQILPYSQELPEDLYC